ncbi:MAG: hypothetical protein H7Z11_18885, partial [Verrucomicrobia bacterium]|nr:hypothetical protein [Leptolyngbya sp. ES-bin-22]
MKKTSAKQVGLGLFVAIALIVMTGCNLSSSQPLSVPSSYTPSPTPQILSTQQPLPQVNPDRLFQHVEALNFERYQASDRDRARRYLVKTLTEFGWKPQLQA